MKTKEKNKNKKGKSLWILLLRIAVCLVLGVLFLSRPDLVISLLPAILGGVLILEAVFRLFGLLALCHKGYRNWWMPLLICVVMVILGTILIIQPFSAFYSMIRIFGGGLLADGILELWILIARKKCQNQTAMSTPADDNTHEDAWEAYAEEEETDTETN